MMTDRELCDALAVRPMGWIKRPEGCGWTDTYGQWVASWNPIEDANDTDRLIDQMTAQGWRILSMEDANGCDVHLTKWDDDKFESCNQGNASDESRKCAVCLAAYEALKGTTDETTDGKTPDMPGLRKPD